MQTIERGEKPSHNRGQVLAMSLTPEDSVIHHTRCISNLALGLMTGAAAMGCNDSSPLGPTRPIVSGEITIGHDYVVYQTFEAYRAAFQTQAEERRTLRSKLDCMTTRISGQAPRVSLRTNLSAPDHISKTVSSYFLRRGAIFSYPRYSTVGAPVPNVDTWFFSVPGRFASGDMRDGGGCTSNGGGGGGSTAWLYGDVSDSTEYGAIDDGYGEDTWPDPPQEAPAGMEAGQYQSLTPGERRLAWVMFWTVGASNFATWVAQMTQLKTDAENWAAEHEPNGALDGPQDALRHAYWMCTFVRTLGMNAARNWGNAHEEGNTDPDAGRMDLYNNEVGRTQALRNGSCGDLILSIKNTKLMLFKSTPPGRTVPSRDPGEMPALDQ